MLSVMICRVLIWLLRCSMHRGTDSLVFFSFPLRCPYVNGREEDVIDKEIGNYLIYLNNFRKMVLRVRPTEKTKRSANLSIVDEEEKRPKSVKKPKTKQKKKSGKIDAKKPKKPPTAFFFFLYVPLLLPFICFPDYNY